MKCEVSKHSSWKRHWQSGLKENMEVGLKNKHFD